MANGSLQFTFDVNGNREFSRIWNELEQIPDDFRSVFDQMAESFYESEKRIFDEEGPGWKPLAFSTQLDRARHGYDPEGPMLRRTSRLFDSLTRPDARDSIHVMRPTSMEIGTSTPYAIYHQTGSIKVHNHPPKRSPMVITVALRKKWTTQMTNWLREEIDYRG